MDDDHFGFFNMQLFRVWEYVFVWMYVCVCIRGDKFQSQTKIYLV